MALHLILGLKAVDRCAKEGRGLIKEACGTEALALYHFTEVVLNNSTPAVERNAYYHVTKTNVKGTVIIGKTVNGGSLPWSCSEFLTPSSHRSGWSYAGLVVRLMCHGT
jgi:hypothetical protein